MKKPNTNPVDKIYKLTSATFPLTYILPARNTKNFSLQYYDEKENKNRTLRYASNQQSPFIDEQTGDILLEPIIFENGYLSVPKSNPVLQEFLYYHPFNNSVFEEVNKAKDASEVVDIILSEADAVAEARALSVDQMESVGRMLFNIDPSRMSTQELKRDILVYAKKDPHGFINILNDPELKIKSETRILFDKNLLVLKKNDIYFNLVSNKKKMVSVPYGEDPYDYCTSYLKSDEGLPSAKILFSVAEEE